MAYKSGYEIVVGARLVPTRAPAYIVGSTKLPWSEVLGKKDKGYSSIFVTEPHRMPSQRQAFQESLEVVQPFDGPSTPRLGSGQASLRTGLRTPPVKPFEPEMVLIPAGEFTMGSDPSLDQDAVDDEQPQHTLYLPDYYLARTSVTNAQYAAFVQATGHHLPEHWIGRQPPTGKEDHPVVYVSWHDAMAYCHWLAKETGKPYHLPSEAEWEKGARGTDGRIWPWGNEWDEKKANTWDGGPHATTPVDAYPAGASPYGLLDMAGNVWEWCQNRLDPRSASWPCVVRGGSWFGSRRSVRCAFRFELNPDNRSHNRGFRVVVSPRLSLNC